MSDKTINYQSSWQDNKNKGFTLVELIVVLVILAVLAAILVPALLGYIDEAKDKQYLLDAKNLFNATQSMLSKVYANRESGDKVRKDPTNSYYANGAHSNDKKHNVVENGRGKGSNDNFTKDLAWIQDYSFSRDVFKLAGYNLNDPHPEYLWYQKNNADNLNKWNIIPDSEKDNVSFLCIGVGHYGKYAQSTDITEQHKAYTAYFMIFQPYQGANYYLFDGSKFLDEWPFSINFASSDANNKQFRYKTTINGEEITIQFLVIKTVTNNKNATNDMEKVDRMYGNN